MLFDPLRLANSIGQNMELYSSLIQQVQQQRRLLGRRQSPSRLVKPPTDQCKPLDLSLKTTTTTPPPLPPPPSGRPAQPSSSSSPSTCSRSTSAASSLIELAITTSSEASSTQPAVQSQPPQQHQHQHKQHNQRPAGQQRRLKQKGAKSHLCRQCGRSFSRSDMLTRHSRLHSGLKPYQCGKCKQVFSRSDHLSTHERTHTGEKPYQCGQCAYSACRRDMITRHMRTHSTAAASALAPTKNGVQQPRQQRQPTTDDEMLNMMISPSRLDRSSPSSDLEEQISSSHKVDDQLAWHADYLATCCSTSS